MNRRAAIVVLDGLGVGAMADVPRTRPADLGAHTLRRVAESAGALCLPNLEALGLGNICQVPGIRPVGAAARGAWGVNRLAHAGADTYMGHQELMGTRPEAPETQLMADVREQVRRALWEAGFSADPVPGSTALLVESGAVVADNIDGEPGHNINVTGSLDLLGFETLESIGRAVRRAVRVSRVIVFANRGYGLDEMFRHLQVTARGQNGIDTPALGVYREGYLVRHFGIGVETGRQLPGLAAAAGLPVSLIGKAADVIECPGAAVDNAVDSARVLELLADALNSQPAGVIVANVQETDLAGHAQDAARWAQLLRLADRHIGNLLSLLRPGDLLFITGDHGNDPGIGHSQHTRERTPLLVCGPGVQPGELGERATLADVAATAAAWLGLGAPAFGTSFLRQLGMPR